MMSRPALGIELLEKAKELLATSKTANEIRICQAVILPLEGMSIEETAATIGRSTSWVAHKRANFITHKGFPPPPVSRKGMRIHANMTLEEETKFLEPFIEGAKIGRIIVVSEIHHALEVQLGRHVGLSSVYELLHRHGWRKLVPDKRHAKADVQAQEDFKKKSRRLSKN